MTMSHVRFLVDDLGPVVAFYRDVVALALVVDVPGVYAEFDAGGGSRLAFYRADLMRDASGGQVRAGTGGDAVVCLRVPDVDAAARAVAARGARLLAPPHDQAAWYQRVAHVADPQGRLVELWSPLTAAPAAR